MSEMRGKNDRHKKEQKIGQKYFVSFSPAAFFFPLQSAELGWNDFEWIFKSDLSPTTSHTLVQSMSQVQSMLKRLLKRFQRVTLKGVLDFEQTFSQHAR
jgi:hypothetical protein